MRFLAAADESDDPMLSVVNVVDVFLVIIAMLLVLVAQRAPEMWRSDAAAEAGEVVPESVETLERFESSGEIGEGTGVRAGTTYRLDDGTLVFVPEDTPGD